MNYYNILYNLKKLENNDELFWNKNSQLDIEKLLNIKPNTLHYYFHRYGINASENRKTEFMYWLNKQSIDATTRVKDLLKNYPIKTTEQAFISKLKNIYGIGFKEYKKSLGVNNELCRS